MKQNKMEERKKQRSEPQCQSQEETMHKLGWTVQNENLDYDTMQTNTLNLETKNMEFNKCMHESMKNHRATLENLIEAEKC